MDSKKRFLSAFLIITFLVYMLPAAIAVPAGENVTNLTWENVTNSTWENMTDSIWENVTNSTWENVTNSTWENVTIDDLTANFTANVTCGYAPLTVDFNDISKGEPTSWNWDFGDGTNSTVESPGTHTVTLENIMLP